jgi:hypothetical protein
MAVCNVYAAEERGGVPVKTLLLAAPVLSVLAYIAVTDGLLSALVTLGVAIAGMTVAVLLWVEFWRP